MDLFAYVDRASVMPIIKHYATSPQVIEAAANDPKARFAILQSLIAGEERLNNLHHGLVEMVAKVNELELRDIVEQLDYAQERFDKANDGGWLGFNVLLAMLILHYAAVTALGMRVAAIQGKPFSMDVVNHWFMLDYSYLRKWWKASEQDGDSPEKRAERAKLYTGNARGALFRIMEGLSTVMEGWVSHYVAKGDKNTCQACMRAQGWYLPTRGPFPGQVCRGRARCRCIRTLVFDPARYKLLTSRFDYRTWDFETGVT